MFLLVLVWLMAVFGDKSREERKRIIVSYDNMCHLNNLKAAKKPLPLPGDLQYLWLDVTKIIDELHIKNHADKRCIEKYNPKEVLSDLSCEHTFAWLSRFKKNPKCHAQDTPPLLLASHGTMYISKCYAEGRRPVQPKLRKGLVVMTYYILQFTSN